MPTLGLDLLNTINRIINTSHDVSETLTNIVTNIKLGLHVDSCTLFLYNRHNNQLELKATTGLNPEKSNKLILTIHQKSLTRMVIEKRKAIAITSLTTHPAYYDIPELSERNYNSFLGLPLVFGNHLVGVLVIHTIKTRRFLKREVILLNTLSNQTAQIILNAKLFEVFKKGNKDNEMHDLAKIDQEFFQREFKEIKTQKPKTTRQIVDFEPHVHKGIAASSGYAEGWAFICEPSISFDQIEENFIEEDQISAELFRFNESIETSKKQIMELQAKTADQITLDYAGIFNAHLMILEDEHFRNKIEDLIKNKHKAEYATRIIGEELIELFSNFDDPYFKDRTIDVHDVSLRVVLNLLGIVNQSIIGGNRIAIAEDITPSDAVTLGLQEVKGIVLGKGGATSHSVILAKSLGIPCVVGTKNIFDHVFTGSQVIVDGIAGQVIVNPTPDLVNKYRIRMHEYAQLLGDSGRSDHLEAITEDGHPIMMLANVGILSDLHYLKRFNAMGIGLYRTEFPFMMRQSLPTLEEQYDIYRKVIQALPDKEVVIRTLDLGGDKFLPYLDLGKENNPYLGWRSIRVSLEMVSIFKTQLKAMLMSSAYGKLRILIPMIMGLDEIYKVKEHLEDVKRELRKEKVTFDEDVPLGVMIEVPSAALLIDKIIHEVDYISIGTNDLIQYTLAVDRNNEKVSNLYEPMHPAIIRLLHLVISECKKANKPVTLCGEMAADPHCTMLLVGLGLERFSMGAPNIPIIKEVIRKLRYEQCKTVAQEALQLSTPKEVRKFFNNAYQELGLHFLFEELEINSL